jgi:GNAT superfamily N-acetyltransferase
MVRGAVVGLLWTGRQGFGAQDLKAYANQGSLPVGMVAMQAGRVCGFAALKEQSIESHSHLLPWAAAGLVQPSMRGRGIGSLLLSALEEQARELGFERIHCATSSAHRHLQRRGWWLIDNVVHDGELLGVYVRPL